MKKLLIHIMTITLLAAGVWTSVEAAPKPVQFAKGKSSAVVKGTIKGSDDVDYVLRAKAGQTLHVDFKASKGAAYFNIVPPNSTYEALFVGSNEGNHYSGTLPTDGDYIIRVYLMGNAKDSGKPVNYTINVGIPVGGKSAGSASDKTSETRVAEKACLVAVAKQVGVKSSQLKVNDVMVSEAATVVMVEVPKATAPWKCFSDPKGHISGVEFSGTEGAQ